MSSGVSVSDGAKSIFNEMKVQKSGDDQNERIRMVSYYIKDGFIEVEKTVRQKDLVNVEDVFKFFQEMLHHEESRYYLYDCHYESKETKKEELVFMMWNPESATIKDKMCYASSKTALTKTMPGLKYNLTCNGFDEIQDKHTFADKLGKSMVTLEGHPMSRSMMQQQQL